MLHCGLGVRSESEMARLTLALTQLHSWWDFILYVITVRKNPQIQTHILQ